MNPRLKRLVRISAVSIIGMVVVLFLCGIGVGYLSASGALEAADAVPWIMGVVAVALMVGAFTVGLVWMRSIDEAAREAHKAAWFWGGSGGMALGGVAVILASLPQAEAVHLPNWFHGRTDPAAWAATGAMAMLLLMLAGYTLVWAWWWLARTRA